MSRATGRKRGKEQLNNGAIVDWDSYRYVRIHEGYGRALVDVVCPICNQSRPVQVPMIEKASYTGVCKGCKAGRHSDQWKGGKWTDGGGYIRINLAALEEEDYSLALPMSYRQGGSQTVLEHRLVMARVLGRPLLSDEIVHHRNGDRADNKRENLQLRIRQNHCKGADDPLLALVRRAVQADPKVRYRIAEICGEALE